MVFSHSAGTGSTTIVSVTVMSYIEFLFPPINSFPKKRKKKKKRKKGRKQRKKEEKLQTDNVAFSCLYQCMLYSTATLTQSQSLSFKLTRKKNV